MKFDPVAPVASGYGIKQSSGRRDCENNISVIRECGVHDHRNDEQIFRCPGVSEMS